MQLAHFVADEFITKPKSGCFGTAATPHSGKQKKDDRNQDRNSQPASLARSLHPAAKPQKPSNSTLDLGLVERVKREIQRNKDVLSESELNEFREALRIYSAIAENATSGED